MKKYGVEVHLFSPSRVCLGIDFIEGVIHEKSGDSNYKELVIGFLFFYVEITLRQK
jgi:hypothetical protein